MESGSFYIVLITAILLMGCKGSSKKPLGLYVDHFPGQERARLGVSYEFRDDGTSVVNSGGEKGDRSRGGGRSEGGGELKGQWRMDGETVVVEYDPEEAEERDTRSRVTFQFDGDKLLRFDGVPFVK